MTVTAPYYDSETLYAPSFSGPSQITAPFLDTLVAFAPTISEVDVAELELKVVGGAVLSNTFQRSFQEQIADTGSFSFQMLRDDFTGIDFDDEIVFKLNGTARFRGLVESLAHVALASGEEADQTVTVSGRGVSALFDQAVVYPSRGVGALPIEEVRTFSWVAPDFDDSAWGNAKKINQQRSYAFFEGGFIGSAGPVPHIWPDTSGWWIWANRSDVSAFNAPAGYCLFRDTFTLAEDATVRVFVAFDNAGTLYVDGAEMIYSVGFTTGQYIEVEMSAGTHTIAAAVRNYPADGDYNPGGVIWAVCTVTLSGLLDDLVAHTDANVKCLPYVTTRPGYTPGEVIRILIEEAGLDSTWDLDFTDNRDTDGNPWSEYPEVAVGVGRTLLEVLQELADTKIDWQAIPGSKTLRAWNRGSRGNVRSVTLQQTTDPAASDFLALSHAGKRTRLNKALIRYAGGHTEDTASSSISEHGVRAAYLELGAVQDEDQAERIAHALMDNRADPAFSTSATIDPRSDTTTPYKSFFVGDFIDCPDETDAPVSMRVLSITMDEDEDGEVSWSLALRDQQLEVEERHDVWLRRKASGALLGGARVSSPAGTPAPSQRLIAALDVAEFSTHSPGSEIPTGLGIVRRAAKSGNIVEIAASLTEPGSTSTTVRVLLNGAELGGTLTIPAGQSDAELAISRVAVRANLDRLQPEVVTAGSGAEGLDIQVRAI